MSYHVLERRHSYVQSIIIVPHDFPHRRRAIAPAAGGQCLRETAQTPYGELTRETHSPASDPPWEAVKPIKDLRRDWPRLKALMGEAGHWQWANTFTDRERIGELGVYSVAVGIPQDWWFFQR